MMSDPTVPQPEANFMAAAEQAIASLQVQARDAADSAAVAKNAAYRAEATARRWRKLTVLLGVVIAMLVATAAVTGYFVNQNRNQADGLRQQAIASCEIGNDRAAGTVAALQQLVTLSEGGHPSTQIKKIGDQYIAFVKAHNKQRNCQQAYSPNAGG